MRTRSSRSETRVDGYGSPVTLHCSCGAQFGCATSSASCSACPWGESCGSLAPPAGRIPDNSSNTLRTKCPVCSATRAYDRSGYPEQF